MSIRHRKDKKRKEDTLNGIRDIFNSVKGKISSMPQATPKVFLDRTRKNLFDLIGKSDIIELTGSVDDFGGPEAVREDVSKAILNLMGVAALFGVDVSDAISRKAAELAEASPGPADEPAPAKGDPEQGKLLNGHATSGGGNGNPAGGFTEPSAERPLPQTDAKGKEDAYIDTLRCAQDRESADLAWKDAIRDKELSGLQKWKIQEVYMDVKKKLAA